MNHMRNRNLREDIRDYWAERAKTYDISPGHGIGNQRKHWHALLTRHLGPANGRNALDLGCGTGEIALLLHEQGFVTTGLDMTPQMLDRARSKAAHLPIRFIEADAAMPMLPNASMDVIVARYLFWTLTDPTAALAQWHRILRPGGTLMLIDGDHVRTPPLAWMAPILDRFIGRDPNASHGLLTEQQWQAHDDIVTQLPFRAGLRVQGLLPQLVQAGFTVTRCDHRPSGLRAMRQHGLRQRLLRIGTHRFAVSARVAQPDPSG